MNTKDKGEATNKSRPTEPLADLELTGEQAEQAKAGTGHSGGGAGKVSFRDLTFTTL